MQAEIIDVDFRNKKRILSYTKYNWKCCLCQKDYLHDSRDPNGNTKRAVISNGKNPLNICHSCVVDIYNAVGGESA